MKSRQQKRKSYTPQQRRAAVVRALKTDLETAAKECNIPFGTLWNWVNRPSSRYPELFELVRTGIVDGEVRNRPAPDEEPLPKHENLAEAGNNVRKKRKVAHVYTPSQKAEVLEYAATHGITNTSNDLGPSRSTIYLWQEQAKLAVDGKGPSPTSGPEPGDLEAQRDKEILGEWRSNPGLGPSQIRNQLRRKGVKVSVKTTRDVMVENGYRPPKVRRQIHNKRFESIRPNHLWHLDFLHRNINKANTFTLVLIDDYSRFVVGHGVDDAERADLVISTFEEAVRRHGKPEMVIHDKGSAFWSWKGISRFTALLTELGVDQVVAECKEWNGKAEVFNANLSKELFDVHRFFDLAEMRKRLAAHLHWFNHRRTHHALGGLLVPADRYFGRMAEVQARIEAGAMADTPFDALDLSERMLEIFKVASVKGRTEIWLMGKKLTLQAK